MMSIRSFMEEIIEMDRYPTGWVSIQSKTRQEDGAFYETPKEDLPAAHSISVDAQNIYFLTSLNNSQHD